MRGRLVVTWMMHTCKHDKMMRIISFISPCIPILCFCEVLRCNNTVKVIWRISRGRRPQVTLCTLF
jgi:hypothetical protein